MLGENAASIAAVIRLCALRYLCIANSTPSASPSRLARSAHCIARRAIFSNLLILSSPFPRRPALAPCKQGAPHHANAPLATPTDAPSRPPDAPGLMPLYPRRVEPPTPHDTAAAAAGFIAASNIAIRLLRSSSFISATISATVFCFFSAFSAFSDFALPHAAFAFLPASTASA